MASRGKTAGMWALVAFAVACSATLERVIGARALKSARQSQPYQNWIGVVQKRLPHDPSRFTEGLTIANGTLYEATGGYARGSSCIFATPLDHWSPLKNDTKQLQRSCAEERVFGEGITVIGNSLYQVTYRSRRALVYDASALEKPIASLAFPAVGPRMGWGLTSNGNTLFVSDGTNHIHIWDLQLRPLGALKVLDPLRPHLVLRLNELEFLPPTPRDPEPSIVANILMSRCLVRFSAHTGRLLGYVILPPHLWPQNDDRALHIMNGVALDSASGSLLITGKNWPSLFWIDMRPSTARANVCHENYVDSIYRYPP